MIKSPIAEQLGGKRTELTVLFSDIRGFTTLSERLSPQEVVGLLNDYLKVMTQVIFDHGGTVDKFEGDAILAFFGAPQSHQDDPERAIRVALGMRERLAEFDEQWIEMTKTPLRIGIGINTGDVVVGNIGSELKMDYTIIGDAVNLASRVQDLTKEYDAPILITGDTKERVEYMCEMRLVDSIEVRGRSQSTDLYEVTNLKSYPPAGASAETTNSAPA